MYKCKFETGDVVQLKSGGPQLTVTGTSDYDDWSRVWVKWFDNQGSLQSDELKDSILKHAEGVK